MKVEKMSKEFINRVSKEDLFIVLEIVYDMLENDGYIEAQELSGRVMNYDLDEIKRVVILEKENMECEK